MKTIKKLELENENSFKIIENGLSANQLSKMELAILRGGSVIDGYDYDYDPSLYACGIEMCGAQACGIQ